MSAAILCLRCIRPVGCRQMLKKDLVVVDMSAWSGNVGLTAAHLWLVPVFDRFAVQNSMNVMNSMQILPGGVGKFLVYKPHRSRWSAAQQGSAKGWRCHRRTARVASHDLGQRRDAARPDEVSGRLGRELWAWLGTRHGPAKVRQLGLPAARSAGAASMTRKIRIVHSRRVVGGIFQPGMADMAQAALEERRRRRTAGISAIAGG